MKLTPGCAGDTWGRPDPGPDLRGLVVCVCVLGGGGVEGEDSQRAALYHDVVGARKRENL